MENERLRELQKKHPLPEMVNWEECNAFFRSVCDLYPEIAYFRYLMEKAYGASILQVRQLSEASAAVFRCLHDDLSYCYQNVFVRTSTGAEDRPAEYRLLRELLFTKYGGLSEEVLSGIYSDYLRVDR